MDWHRTLSGLLAAAYLILAMSTESLPHVLRTTAWLVFTLACIWFPDELGESYGAFQLQPITRPTPGCFVRFAGWALLLMPLWIRGIKLIGGP